jgi:hypothetical protein
MVMHHATDEIEILRKDVDFAHSKFELVAGLIEIVCGGKCMLQMYL